jgi:hypothetical protein
LSIDEESRFTVSKGEGFACLGAGCCSVVVSLSGSDRFLVTLLAAVRTCLEDFSSRNMVLSFSGVLLEIVSGLYIALLVQCIYVVSR